LSNVGVTNKTGFYWILGFIAPYTFIFRDYRQYSAITVLHTLLFTVTHTHQGSQSSLVLSWQRIYYSLTINFRSHMQSSGHSLISFFAIILRLPTPKTRLKSITLLPRSHTSTLASRNSTLPLFSTISSCILRSFITR
jgi:hypothetical protein